MTEHPETTVVLAGDWHGNTLWACAAIQVIGEERPGVETILHLGDFGIYPNERAGRRYLAAVDQTISDARSTGSQLRRILVTPGNHEHWGWLEPRLDGATDPLRVSETVSVLPRPHRFELGGRTFLSLGGAASVDRAHRRPGRTWWPAETPTLGELRRAAAGGHADVMLSHETVDGGTAAVERILRDNPLGWPQEALEYGRISREQTTEVWDAVNPRLLVHGHMHAADAIRRDDGRTVISLGCDGQVGNVAYLDLRDLSWEWSDGVNGLVG